MDKLKEKLLYETYERFQQTGMNIIPPSEIDTFVDKDVMGYGTTLDEKILSASGFLELVEKQKEQSKDIEMKFDSKPVLRRILEGENAAIFVNEVNISFQIDSETFKMFLRLTSILEYRENIWLVVHWHASKPEYEEGGEDTWHIEEHKAKTERLEKEVAEKTADLLVKNQELEIEAALERVRASAMAMNKPEDMLDVCRIISYQLESLGINNIRNVQTAIFEESNRIYTNFEYYSLHNKTFITDIDYSIHPKQTEFAKAMITSPNSFFTASFAGEELSAWIENQRKTSQFIDPFLEKAVSLNYYFHSVGPVALGMSSYSPLSPEGLKIFKRFRNVFELSYKRFQDIKQAEALAREAQIEAALEKVRSSALGMSNSQEVGNVTDKFFNEFTKLSVDLIGCSMVVIDEKEDIMELWRARSNVVIKPFERSVFKDSMKLLKRNMPEWFPKFYGALVERSGYLVKEMVENDRERFLNTMAEQYNYTNEEKIKLLEVMPKNIAAHFIFIKIGYLALISKEQLSEDDLSIARRFADVFNFAYTRFLDIKNAEVQAREAQIEVALERVRARTMAMQKSSELAVTAAHLFSQLNELGIHPYRCNIAIISEKSATCQLWSTTNSGNVIPTSSSIPLYEHPVLIEMYEGWKEKKKNHVIKLVDENRLEWTKYIRKYVHFQEYKPEQLDEIKIKNEPAIFSNLHFKQGFFVIHTVEELSDVNLNTTQRFANVFEQTYTRFLDLERAEAQNKLIQAENERKTRELEEARELQLAMLPKNVPDLPNLEISVYMKTATEVGGDYYDFHVGDDNVLTGVIGDATGHGMKAGTIVTITKSMFNSLAPDQNILETFFKISKVIKDMKFRQLSMCLLMFKIDGNILSLSSAAMPPALIYRDRKKIVEEIELSGMPLGSMINFPYKLVETKVHPGDTILLMSDGFTELIDDKKFMYGFERTKSEFLLVGNKKTEEILEYLKKSASNWLNERVPDDDITFVVIKVK
ncbi:MAG: SpoIIE family protein phosphatase [Ignavibacteriae bacterium]|nr:SpoIIE family protein phosphatase [Ignavibacteriota bacterium]